MREHSVNSLDNFISAWYADDTKFCDEIINYFESSDQFVGQIVVGDKHIVDKTRKDSLEVNLNNNEYLIGKYKKHLAQCVNEYIKKYPESNNTFVKFGDLELTRIQKYPPNGGFFGWHCERSSASPLVSARHLVFMTYLNNVNDGGETEFKHQKVKVKPEKGLTLIWPTDWPFTHRGIPSPQEKYIVTGWLSFVS